MTYLLSTSKITHLPQEAEWTPSTEVDRRFGLSCYPFGDSNRSLVTLTGQAHTHRTLHTVLHNLKQVAPPLILVDDASWNNKNKLLQLMFCGSRRSRLSGLQATKMVIHFCRALDRTERDDSCIHTARRPRRRGGFPFDVPSSPTAPTTHRRYHTILEQTILIL